MTGAQDHDDVFERLIADPAAFIAERRAAVVSDAWAPQWTVAHVPEPLYRMRRPRGRDERADVLHPGQPPETSDEHWNGFTRFGLDAAAQIAWLVGYRAEWQHRQAVQLRTPTGELLWTATLETDKRPRVELTSYGYEQGRMVNSRRTVRGVARSQEWRSDRPRWFRYDEAGRLVLVLDVGPRNTGLGWPSATRIHYEAGQAPVAVTTTYGRAQVSLHADPAAQLSALLDWEATCDNPRQVISGDPAYEVAAPPQDPVLPLTLEPAWGAKLITAENDKRSKIGGAPELPPGTPWPECDEGPLHCIATIHLAELPDFPDRELLPADGTLVFFYRIDPDGILEPADARPSDPARVIHVPANTPVELLTPPGGHTLLGERPVRGSALLTYASLDEEDDVDEDVLAEKYGDLILGHPGFIQEDSRIWPGMPTEGWISLLCVNHDEQIDLHLADGGQLTYLIAPDALAARDWDTVHVDAQCH